MNDRIQELAEQSKEYAAQNATGDWEVGPSYQYIFNKKFAELIVRECVNKITAEQDTAEQNWSCKNGKHIAWEMLDHFGIDS